MPTFGKTTTGGQSGDVYGGFKYVGSYALGVEGWASKLTADLDGLGAGTGAQTVRGVIYADSAGQPGSLLAQGTDVSVADSQVRGWVDLPFANPVHLPAGTYWLGVADSGGASQTVRLWSTYNVGHGRHSSGGITDPFGTGTVDDDDVAVYATYTTTPPVQTLSITSPAPAAVLSNVATLTFSASGFSYHHIQPEYSIDGGTTWLPLTAACEVSTTAYFNTRRLRRGSNGSLKLRLKAYQDALETILVITSAVVDVSISNATGVVHTVTSGTLSAAIALCSPGDVLELDGDFTDPATVHFNVANLTVRKRAGASQNPRISQRSIIDADGVVFQDVKFQGAGAQRSPQPQEKAAWFYRCEVTNGASGIGVQDGGTPAFDPDGAFDTVWEEGDIHDIGDRVTEWNASHGIYAQNSTRLLVYNTKIYRCAGRCIQLYPRATEATIDKTLAYDAEAPVNIGGDSAFDPTPSSHTLLRRSIIGKGGGLDGSTSNGLVYTFWGSGITPGTDNYVVKCFLHDPPTGGFGAGHYIDTSSSLSDGGGNITGLSPQYGDPANGNFRLPATSPAVGYGPDSIQPSAPGPKTLTASSVTIKPLSATAVTVNYLEAT